MNPFRYGQVVGSDFYCPRPDLESLIAEKIASSQNILIRGERRTGKTSLILRAIQSMKNKKPLYIDLLEVKTVEDVHKRFLNAIVRYESKSQFLQATLKRMASLRPVMTFDSITGLPAISVDNSIEFKPDSLSGLLELLGEPPFSRAVVVIDEFQDILNLKDAAQTLAIMRSTIQFLDKAPLIFCGSILNKMDSIFNDHQSPFFKSAQTINVGPIDHIEFKQFIEKKFEKIKLRISTESLEKIFTMAGENPGDIQQLCSALYDVAEKNSVIVDSIMSDALEYIFAQEQKGYEACLTQVTALQFKCLVAVARLGGKGVFSRDFLTRTGIRQPSTIRKSLQRLQDLKILFHGEEGYRFVNPYFARWIVWRNF